MGNIIAFGQCIRTAHHGEENDKTPQEDGFIRSYTVLTGSNDSLTRSDDHESPGSRDAGRKDALKGIPVIGP